MYTPFLNFVYSAFPFVAKQKKFDMWRFDHVRRFDYERKYFLEKNLNFSSRARQGARPLKERYCKPWSRKLGSLQYIDMELFLYTWFGDSHHLENFQIVFVPNDGVMTSLFLKTFIWFCDFCRRWPRQVL